MSNIEGGKLAGQVSIATGGTVGVAELMDVLSANIGLLGIGIAFLSICMQTYFSFVNLRMQIKRLDLDQKEESLSRREQALNSKLKIMQLSKHKSSKS